MELRDKLLKLQEDMGDNWITIDNLPKEFKYVPEVFGATEEIHIKKISALLYDYNISARAKTANETTGRKSVEKFKILDKKKELGKWEKFVQLANPDDNGVSETVTRNDFYKIGLTLGNGGDFCRESSTLAKLFNLTKTNNESKGNSIDALKLDGYNTEIPFNQCIASRIRTNLQDEKCVMLGINGTSENTKIEIDHKDGRKNDLRVSDPSQQKLEDFQPLCKAANDVKRQICKECKTTNRRWNAQNIKGNPFPFYEGTEEYKEELGCVGCYQYDPVKYRISSARKLSQMTIDFIMSKIYPEYNKDEQ